MRKLVFITILGGVSHSLGAFVGAAIFEAVKLTASAYMAGVWQLLLGLTLLVVIVVAPDGIIEAMRKLKLAEIAAEKSYRWAVSKNLPTPEIGKRLTSEAISIGKS